MSESIRQTIEELRRHVEQLENESVETKKIVNSLCRRIGDKSLEYPESELSVSGSTASSAPTFRGDEFFNKPLASAARLYLEARKSPATLDEIYEAMCQGGFAFETKADEAKHSLATSLGKNSTTFVRHTNGKIGLAEWYGGPREPKFKKASGKKSNSDKGAADPELSSDPSAAAEADETMAFASPGNPK